MFLPLIGKKGWIVMENMSYLLGCIVGVLVGVIIFAILAKKIHSDGNYISKYDEMQMITRGKAYKYAFWAIVIIEALFGILLSADIKLPLSAPLLHIIVIFIGIIVQISYCIWNNAYIGLNDNMNRFAIFSVFISLFNFGIAFHSYRKGELIVNGVFQTNFINLVCGFLFIIIGVELLIKKIFDGKEEKEAA